MIPDLAVLTVIGRQRAPLSRITIANCLDIDADNDLSHQLSRFVKDELCNRSNAQDTTTFLYSLTTKGHERLVAEGVDLSKLPRLKPMNRPQPELMGKQIPPKVTAAPTRLRAEAEPQPGRRKSEPVPALTTTREVPTVKDLTETKNRIAAIIATVGDWMSTKTVAKAAKIKPAEARRVLAALVKDNRIQSHGATSSKVYGKLGMLPPAPGEGRATKAAPKTKARKAKRARTPRKARASKFAKATLAVPGLSAFPIASFTAKGEIHVHGGAGNKLLDKNESAAVVELVRAFDKAELLARPA